METEAKDRKPDARLTKSGVEYRPRGSGSIFLPRNSTRWCIKYFANSKQRTESSHSTDRKVAERLLRKRLQEADSGELVSSVALRVKIDQLVADLLSAHEQNGVRTAKQERSRWTNDLAPHFGGMKAARLTSAHIERYKTAKLAEGYAPATINRGLQVLRASFRLAMRRRTIHTMPAFELLPERNTRSGFLSEEKHDKLRAACAEEGLWLVAFLEIACTFAWRASEVLNLRVRNIDLFGGGRGTIRLDANTTKNKQGRVVPLTENVRTLITQLMLKKRADDFLLTRDDGKRVREPRGAWRRACIRAGLGEFQCRKCQVAIGAKRTCPECGTKWKEWQLKYSGLLAHDLRRSGARNLLRAGVPEVTAMAIGGWVTNQTFKRYAIVSENDLARALDKLETMKKAERELAAIGLDKQNSAESGLGRSSLQVAGPKLPS